MFRRAIVMSLVLTVGVAPTFSVSAQETYQGVGPPTDTLYPLPKVDGAVPWETLANVEMVYEGVDLVPEYSDEVHALVGQTVKMVGFIMPLSSDGKRSLLSMISPNCPFCLPGGPETFVELMSDEPVDWTDDAVVVTGTFELLEDGWTGYYYRMTGVERVDDPSVS